MKRSLLAAALALTAALAVSAEALAQGYYSQRARQDREYKSLSNATQRAYGSSSSSSSSSSYKRR